jgi:hypothetical protein
VTLMPEVHDALADAVAARAPHRRRRRWRPSRPAALIAVGGLIAGGTALAATTGGWQPVLGSPEHGPQPRAAGASVPADQLAALSVLRRSPTAADHGPLVREGLSKPDRELMNGIHTDAIRVIFQTAREIAILVPVERFGPPGRAHHHGLCLLSSSAGSTPQTAGRRSWGGSCADLEQLRTSGIAVGTQPNASGGMLVEGRPQDPTIRQVVLVPDGVARVTVRLRHGRSVTVPVRDNVYRYTTTESPAFMGTLWFDAAGRRIDHRDP